MSNFSYHFYQFSIWVVNLYNFVAKFQFVFFQCFVKIVLSLVLNVDHSMFGQCGKLKSVSDWRFVFFADYKYIMKASFGGSRRRMLARRLGRDRPAYRCPKCERTYTSVNNVSRHLKYECGQPPKFKCPYCDSRSKQRTNTYRHVRLCHPGYKVDSVEI